ncbi:DUF481 domain-containing protein [Henriciella sp. AS95]|uniref:DUF481 domain-containing protein n=1 Tax=Henriciella sp. AS95 TaxID=3135782 RepID=UPI00316D2181
MTKRISLILTASICLAPFAAADDGWTGEGSFSAGYTTGNTETTDLGLAVKLNRDVGIWTYTGEAAADYGETESIETKNRFFLAGEVDRQLGDKLFGFGRTSYEQDEFSGFDSRFFAGVGLGYPLIETEQTNWSVQGGPGIKIDEVRDRFVDVNGVPTLVPGSTEQSFSVIASSDFSHKFNEAVSLTNSTNAIYAQESTQLGNVIALTAALTDTFSARFSFDVRHDTNPPEGFEATDTVTRASIVYAFGN